MTSPLTAQETLDREFLLIRAKLLEIAAALDRVQRGSGSSVDDDSRLAQIDQAIRILRAPENADAADRAHAIQLVFSLPYSESWRDQFQMTSTTK